MNNEHQKIRHRKIFLVCAYIAIAFIAAAIWVINTVDVTPGDEAKMANLDKTDLNLGPKLTSTIQKRLYEVIDQAYGIRKNEAPVANIRKETIKTNIENDGTTHYSFLIDVDNYEITYRTNVWTKRNTNESEVYFACVTPKESKYPDNFCIGYNGHSTIDVTIAPSLPLTGRMTVKRNIYDARVEYEEGTIRPYIDLFVNACGDQEIINDVRDDFSKWIKSQGYEPTLFRVEVPENCSDKE